MVNARLCKTATHFGFLECETEISKYFECERARHSEPLEIETARHLRIKIETTRHFV